MIGWLDNYVFNANIFLLCLFFAKTIKFPKKIFGHSRYLALPRVTANPQSCFSMIYQHGGFIFYLYSPHTLCFLSHSLWSSEFSDEAESEVASRCLFTQQRERRGQSCPDIQRSLSDDANRRSVALMETRFGELSGHACWQQWLNRLIGHVLCPGTAGIYLLQQNPFQSRCRWTQLLQNVQIFYILGYILCQLLIKINNKSKII